MVKQYALTISCNSHLKAGRDFFEKLLTDLQRRYKITIKERQYERGKGLLIDLHVHLYFEASDRFNGFPMIKFISKQHSSCKIEEIYDLEGWIEYMRKNIEDYDTSNMYVHRGNIKVVKRRQLADSPQDPLEPEIKVKLF